MGTSSVSRRNRRNRSRITRGRVVFLSEQGGGRGQEYQAIRPWRAGDHYREPVFLKDGELKVQLLGRGFAWLDTGTHDSLSEASTFVEVIEKRQGLKVACLEEIAFKQGWIDEKRLEQVALPMIKNQYGQYLMRLINK